MSAPMHDAPHPRAGQQVMIAHGTLAGHVFRIEDWYDRVAGCSWMDDARSPTAWKYACRAGVEHLPVSNEVLYGKIGGMGELVHVSELAADDNEADATGEPS